LKRGALFPKPPKAGYGKGIKDKAWMKYARRPPELGLSPGLFPNTL
jgi:hypothetical protein